MLDKEAELIPPTRQERRTAERAYFSNRIDLLMNLKRLRTKRVKVREVAVEQLPLFPSG
jgi:hypothetical protein